MTTALALRPEDRAEIEAEAPRNAAALAELEAMIIATSADLEYAGEILVCVKARWKELEEKRKTIKDPIVAAGRAVDALFKPVQKPLEQAEAVLKEKISAFMLAERAAQVEAMRDVAAGGDASALAMAVPAPAPAGVGVREVWDFEVVDEDRVTTFYKSVDAKKVRGWIDSFEGGEPAPLGGIRFFKRGQVRVRAG